MKVLDSFGLRSHHLIHLLLFLCHEVDANTEIINFSSSRESAVDLPLDVVGNWSTLRPTENEQQWSLEPAALHTPLHQVCERTGDASTAAPHPPFSCPHELWLLLDLDDERWASYSTFTLRLSWPASTPADFALALYSPQDLFALLAERELVSGNPERAGTRARAHTSTSSTRHVSTTRSKYARIRAVHAGVPTPGPRSHPHSDPSTLAPPLRAAPFVPVPASRPASDAGESDHVPGQGRGEGKLGLGPGPGPGPGTVPLCVILEPTYLGVLPATLLHTAGFLIPVVLAAAAFVPWVLAYVERYAQQAREDLKAGVTCRDKDR